MNVLLTGRLWTYEVKTDGKGHFTSGIREGALEQFVKKCDPEAKLTDDNALEWIFRYIVEEKDYPRDKIIYVKISE